VWGAGLSFLECVRGKLTSWTGGSASVRRHSRICSKYRTQRTAGTFRRLAKVRAELGWTSVRVRDLTRGGYKEQVRGYCGPAQKKNAMTGHVLAGAPDGRCCKPQRIRSTTGPESNLPSPLDCFKLPCSYPHGYRSQNHAQRRSWRRGRETTAGPQCAR
jgi:hypothetical protein